MLADLRKQVVRLAKQTYQDRTGERAKATVKSRKRPAKRKAKPKAKASA
jgi:hypothetical protein